MPKTSAKKTVDDAAPCWPAPLNACAGRFHTYDNALRPTIFAIGDGVRSQPNEIDGTEPRRRE